MEAKTWNLTKYTDKGVILQNVVSRKMVENYNNSEIMEFAGHDFEYLPSEIQEAITDYP